MALVLTLASLSTLSSPKQQGTVALVYHGDYTRGTADDHDVTCQGPCTPDAEKQPKCTDFFLAAYNQYVNLVVPLQQMGLQLDSFFHTYSWSYCPARDAALVDFLQPVAYRFDEQGKYPRIVDTYIAAIDIMLESGGVYDYVLLLRFEALYDRGIDALDVSWGKINVAFKAQYELYNESGVTSDLFYVTPWSLLGTLREGLDASGDVPQQWEGSGHYTYGVLQNRYGDEQLHLVQGEDAYVSSSEAAFDVCEAPEVTTPPNSTVASSPGFVYLLRACTATECDAVLAACVEGEVATGGARVPLPACDGFGLVTNASSPLACAGRKWVNVTTTMRTTTHSPSASAQMAMLGLAVGIAAGACAGRGRRSAAGARDTSVGRDPTAWQHVQPHSQSYDLRPNAAVAMAKSGRAAGATWEGA